MVWVKASFRGGHFIFSHYSRLPLSYYSITPFSKNAPTVKGMSVQSLSSHTELERDEGLMSSQSTIMSAVILGAAIGFMGAVSTFMTPGTTLAITTIVILMVLIGSIFGATVGLVAGMLLVAFFGLAGVSAVAKTEPAASSSFSITKINVNQISSRSVGYSWQGLLHRLFSPHSALST